LILGLEQGDGVMPESMEVLKKVLKLNKEGWEHAKGT
jgi:hypothetical protein